MFPPFLLPIVDPSYSETPDSTPGNPIEYKSAKPEFHRNPCLKLRLRNINQRKGPLSI
jgi:hypothetical protein